MIFPGKLVIQQRVLPAYRASFFSTLAPYCEGGLSVFAGQARPDEGIHAVEIMEGVAYTQARNQHLLGGPLYFCRQPGLVDWLKDERPDALIVEANPRYLSAPAAVEWIHGQGRIVLGWGLGAPPLSGPLSGLRGWSRRRLLLSLDGVIAYSQRGAEEYRKLGLPEGRVFVAANAAAPPPNAMPQRTPNYEGRPQVLFVGRLQARKNLDVLFAACAGLPEALQPVVVVVGDGPARTQFEKIAQQTYASVIFTGALQGEALNAQFERADLFVLPGTGGLAIQQAMSHGLPVVVAQGDGTQDDLVRPGNGWLVRPGDADDLRVKLSLALSDVSRLRRMGTESFRITRDEINIERMAQAFIEALNAVGIG
jgi:glycosyltransferase involved in cell wall biosynthesis